MDPFADEPEMQAALDRWQNIHAPTEPARPQQPPTLAAPLGATADAPRPAPAPLPEVEGYEVLDRLGHGGMGVVYKARHLGLNRVVALKMLPADQSSAGVGFIRFLTEVEATARLEHPNIVHVYEVGQSDGRPFYTMELVDGGTLAARINRTPRPPREAAELMEKVSRAVQFAHEHHIVHRDLKPLNVLLTPDGTPKVSDFGLAKRLDLTQGVTQPGERLGTPSYMAPEQVDNRSSTIGPAADVYALGATLYDLLTGRPPFQSPNPHQTMMMVVSLDAVPPRRLQPGVPRDLETICLKCLRKEPRKRYPAARDVADELRRYLDGKPILARPVGHVERAVMWAKRGPWRATALAVGLFVLVGVTVATVAVRRQRDADRLAAQQDEQAKRLVQALTTAETAEVPGIIGELAGVRDRARPGLATLAAEAVNTKRGLHGLLALLADEPGRADALIAYLPDCRPDELLTIRKSLPPLEPAAAIPLWRVLADDRAAPGRRVRAACALAASAPDDPRWGGVARVVVEGVVRAEPAEFAVWVQALEPIGPTLLPTLLARYPNSQGRVEEGKLGTSALVAEAAAFDLTARLLARYTADRPAELAEAAILADARHHPLLAPALIRHQERVGPHLRAELAKPKLPSSWTDMIPQGPAIAAVAGVAGLPLHSTLRIASPDPSGPGGVTGVAGSLPATNPDLFHDIRARRQANAAAVLFALGQPEAAWPLLVHSPDPTVRSYLIARLAAVGADPGHLIRRFGDDPDLSAKRAVLLALGDFPREAVPGEVREPFVRRLLGLYRSHPDPGLHSAIDWLLRQQWRLADEVAGVDTELRGAAEFRAARARALSLLPNEYRMDTARGGAAADDVPVSDWFVNRYGQTFAVVRGPVAFVMGTSPVERGRNPDRFAEWPHLRGIDRTFAIATREVTFAEIRQNASTYVMFERDNTEMDAPAAVPWYLAARYCNWLSWKEGIPEDQWCYEPNPKGRYGAGMKIKPGHLNLTGYRLPTEAEWEYACRAGSTVSRYFGRSDELLPRYGWFRKNSDDRAWPVGRLRPNDLGLFDALGNANEWTEDPGRNYVYDRVSNELVYAPDFTPATGPYRGVLPDRYTGARFFPVPDTDHVEHMEVNDIGHSLGFDKRVFRGGAYLLAGTALRSAERRSTMPTNQASTIGFRPVRTLEVHR